MPRCSSQHVAPAPARDSATIFSAIIVRNRCNEPDIPYGSVAFLEGPGFTGEGWYAIGHDGQQPADIRLICRTSEGYVAKFLHPKSGNQKLSRAALERIKPHRVAGVAKPYTLDFERFADLREGCAMTDKTLDPVARLMAETEAGIIAAYRYLVFLELELGWLKHELFPDFEKGDYYFVPSDRQVNLATARSPLTRAVPVLTAVGVDPHATDTWTEMLPSLPGRLRRGEIKRLR